MTPRTLLHEILAEGGLSVLFQPIFEIGGQAPEIFALEALSRGPKGSNAERADVLFEYVRRKAKEPEVDHACVAVALKAASEIPRSHMLSINVHSSTLERDDQFPEFLADTCGKYQMPMSNLILEIVEQQKYWDEQRFFRAVGRLRAAGVRIALDDIGLGYSNYRMMIELRPDFYKIDRYFVAGCATKDNARAAMESIVLLARRLGGCVIAEGIECREDLETVLAMGIDFGQGYHFARPATASELFNQIGVSGTGPGNASR